MEAKHTPGPWVEHHIHVCAECGELEKDGYHSHCIVEAADGRTDEECIANARLIAAAPELLEACYISRPTFQQMVKDNPNNIAAVNCLRWIDKATAKAEGRE